MRLALVLLLLLSVVNLAAALGLRGRVAELEAPPPEPTVHVPGLIPLEAMEEPPIRLPLPEDWVRGGR